MKQKEQYSFEILIIDRLHESEISTLQSISMGISYSEKLWKHPEIKQASSGPLVEDTTLGIALKVRKVNAEDAAFLIKVEGSNFEKMEKFRKPLLLHIKNNLHFNTIKLLNDGVSARLGQGMYPLIKNVENNLRSYLAKYHNKKSGFSWWNNIASNQVVEEVNLRKEAKSIFSDLVDKDIILTRCEELGEFIHMAFPSKTFQTKWDKLVNMKKRIAYNDVFDTSDATSIEKITSELTDSINKAAMKLGQLKIAVLKEPVKTAAVTKKVNKPAKKTTIKAKAAVKKAQGNADSAAKPLPSVEKAIKKAAKVVKKEVLKKEPIAEIPKQEPVVEAKTEAPNPVKVTSPKKKSSMGFELISEEDLLAELKSFESSNDGTIDLKAFVIDILTEKGYAAGPAYSQARNLDEKGLVKIYETKDKEGMMMKAVKVN